MSYSDSQEKSSEYLRLALKHMGRYGVPVDPINYAVWYEYVSGRNRQLKEAIEAHLKDSNDFTEEVNHCLYKNYIADEDRALMEKIRDEVRRILAEVLTEFTDAGGEISKYGKALENYTGQLLETVDAEKIKRIVSSLVSDTRTMGESSLLLRARLTETSNEIESLRMDLEKAKRQAKTDALTGLANRGAFETALAGEMDRSADSGKPLSLMFADIDHFKRINDTFGHLVGDKVLRTTAATLRSLTRGQDLVARYGGEEFVMILPDTPLEGAMTVAEKIRSEFEKKQWKRKDTGEPIGSITLSIGAALYRRGEAPEALIERADTALYAAKESGRNRVTSELNEGQTGMRVVASRSR
jgi:diguanylate cyclase